MHWLAPLPAVLASKSAVRRQLLEAAGVPVDVLAAAVDERAIEDEAGVRDAAETALLLAAAKAHAAASVMPGRLVIAADQTLSCQGAILHKAQDREQARRQLQRLRGVAHSLHAAVAVIDRGRLTYRHVGTAELTMRAFSDAFLESYLDAVGDDAFRSVGGYRLEGPGVQLFERIDGDYFTVLGLPLVPLLGHLRDTGFLSR